MTIIDRINASFKAFNHKIFVRPSSRDLAILGDAAGTILGNREINFDTDGWKLREIAHIDPSIRSIEISAPEDRIGTDSKRGLPSKTIVDFDENEFPRRINLQNIVKTNIDFHNMQYFGNPGDTTINGSISLNTKVIDKTSADNHLVSIRFSNFSVKKDNNSTTIKGRVIITGGENYIEEEFKKFFRNF